MGKCCQIYNLMHDVETAMLHYLEISNEILVVVWYFNIRYGQMVLERQIRKILRAFSVFVL